MMPRPRTIITANALDFAFRATELFKSSARANVDQRGRFVAALSGGSTPRGMYRLLASSPTLGEIPWERTHFFWVDERCVPLSDAESNFGTAWREVLGRVPLPPENIHSVSGDHPPEESADEYQMEMTRFFNLGKGEFPVFDLVFLGMGKDGHTASLFPRHMALEEEKRLVVAVKGGTPDVWRITMTYPVLNRARQIVFLVSGIEKAEAVRALIEGSQTQLPAGKIRPVHGDVLWLLDREAASLLT